MSLPDEFADAFPGAFAGVVTEPAPEVPAAPAAPQPVFQDIPPTVTASAPSAPAAPPVATGLTATEPVLAPGRVPAPRVPQMGPEATDLPPLDHPDLPDLGHGTDPVATRDLRLLSEVQVELAVELGRVKLPLRDLLALGPGAVLELDRPADAPVDVLVNGCLVARGEVVVIDGEFGVRVTAVIQR
ncbi:MAG: fliN [Frankiales bacterium]|jgi:flagellar motor switch protein FliN/FliY|nr:fliN [Frankiales bacterium]